MGNRINWPTNKAKTRRRRQTRGADTAQELKDQRQRDNFYRQFTNTTSKERREEGA